MIFATHPEPSGSQSIFTRRRVRVLALLLLVLLVSFICMLIAAQVALISLDKSALARDVRSVIEVDYGAGAQRVAPLDPRVIEEVERELELTQMPAGAFPVPFEPMVEIPSTQPTAVAEVSPIPTRTLTPTATRTPPRPTDTRQLPVHTSTSAATDTPVVASTATPTPATPTPTPAPTTAAPPPTVAPVSPTVVPSVTPVPSPTFTWTPAPGPTDTPVTPSTLTLTATTAPSETPTPTDTPAPSDTPTLTSTPVSPTPTATPTPTLTPTATALPPVVLGITPIATVQGSGSDPNFDVVIEGQNFVAPVTSWLGELGQSILISVLEVSSTHITGTLSPNIPVGVYGLTVQNADARTGTRSPAFTVYPRGHPTTTFESAVAFVSTFGPVAPATEGDSDHVQIIFFEVPDTAPDNLYVRIFDADTGGLHDEVGLDGSFNSVITFTVRGGTGAYTNPEARSHAPGRGGINSGTLIVQNVIGVDNLLDNAWLTLGVNRTQGELVEGSRLFKLSVQGAAGDDGNRYQVAISSDPTSNIGVAGARLFAYSWCVVLPASADQVAVYPHVPFDATNVTQVNFDFDVSPGASITLSTPLRNVPVSAAGLSGPGGSASETFSPFAGERATTWTVLYTTGQFTGVNNDFSIWFFANGSQPLAIFNGPTLVSVP